MAHPIGQPSYQEESGDWVGMTPQGIQRVIGSSYMNEGVVPGGGSAKAKGTTGWSYTIPAMTVFARTDSDGRGVLIPVEAQTLPVSAPIGGATRTDSIYVEPVEGNVRVNEGKTTAPGVIIDRMVIPATATNTQGATSNWDTTYAIPAGASLGCLAHWDIPAATWTGDTDKDVVRHTARFSVPTDRLVRVEVSLGAQSTSSANGWAAMGVEINGTWRRALHAAYDGRRDTRSGTWTAELPSGAHTLTVFTRHFAGTHFKTGAHDSASEVNVWDAGAAV